MKYINSKSEEVALENINDFHLLSAAKKADAILNFITGFLEKDNHNVVEEWKYVARYVAIVHLNLWVEVQERDLENPMKKHFKETFKHLGDEDKIALWNFIKVNYTPKEK